MAKSTAKSALTRRVLDMLTSMAESKAEDYAVCWAQFGNVLKEGVAEDLRDHRAQLVRLLVRRQHVQPPRRRVDPGLGAVALERRGVTLDRDQLR